MNLLIVGAPGSGKGTMSDLIIEHFGLTHVSTGDMFRAAMAIDNQLGKEVKEYMESGKLVPDEVVHEVVVERFEQPDMKEGFLLDGYPRTLEQAIDFQDILKTHDLKLDCVIRLTIDETALKGRITGRRVCPNCKEIYHIVANKPSVEGICDKCGSSLIQRSDDTLESLETRLKEYHRLTEPVIGYYEKMGIVKYVNANQDVDRVFADIKTILEDYK